jgi:hypothetical protein
MEEGLFTKESFDTIFARFFCIRKKNRAPTTDDYGKYTIGQRYGLIFQLPQHEAEAVSLVKNVIESIRVSTQLPQELGFGWIVFWTTEFDSPDTILLSAWRAS